MFKNLTDRLSKTLRYISRTNRLTESNIRTAIKEVRIALLEADVSFLVVKNFIKQIQKKCINYDISKNFTPFQEFIKIVKQELIFTMGNKNMDLNLKEKSPIVILLIGLEGVGKTTTTAKLGKFIKEKYQKKPLLVSTDIYRPAAIKQLNILSKDSNIDYFTPNISNNLIKIADLAFKYAKNNFYDVLLIDTPGCSNTNLFLLKKLKELQKFISPIEILFIVDSMTGQDSINSIEIFNKFISLTGIILTKIDGDVRGGSALSITYMTKKPIKFIGVGEKLNDLEIFYPDRIASRILGMGDIVSLIEEIEYKVKSSDTLFKKKEKKNNFDFNDFKKYLEYIHNLDILPSFVKKFPNFKKLNFNIGSNINENLLLKMKSIINSMTPKERENPEIIKGSQKRRISNGSGVKVQDVNILMKQFLDMQNMMKNIKKRGIKNILYEIKNRFIKS